jgi:hypothetical protein
MDAAFDALHVRMRELLEQGAGALRTIPADRFTGGLPAGGTEADDAVRGALSAIPCEARVVSHRPHSQTSPVTGDRRLLRIDVEVRVIRTLAWAEQAIDSVRDAAKALAAEDGDVIAQVFEWPPNLYETEAGAQTGAKSLVRSDSTSLVVGTTGQTQRIETLHRFTGMLEASRDVVASSVANTTAPAIGILNGGVAALGEFVILQPGTWANAITIATVLLIDGVANVVAFPFEILAEHIGATLQVRETATGTGGPVVATSGTITPA